MSNVGASVDTVTSEEKSTATNSDVSAITTIISVVMVLTALWCFLANYFAKHSFIADIFRRIGRRVLPFVLIGLGLFILVAFLTD